MSETLLPCPWCGGTNTQIYPWADGDGETGDYVQCLDCTACGPDHKESRHWNRRAALATTRGFQYEQVPLPQAFFDEFGKGADDRVQDYAYECVKSAIAQNLFGERT